MNKQTADYISSVTQRKWYYKHGACYEVFNILYDDGRFMLVENDETKSISFGLCRNFGTLYGFPVNWSCLSVSEAVNVLRALIGIDEKYHNTAQIEQWENMISALSGAVVA